MKNFIFASICGLLMLSACNPDAPPAYSEKSIIIDSLFTDWERNQTRAMEKADGELLEFAKTACRSRVGAGWSFSAIGNNGEMYCEAARNKHHCQKKKVTLTCRRITEFFP